MPGPTSCGHLVAAAASMLAAVAVAWQNRQVAQLLGSWEGCWEGFLLFFGGGRLTFRPGDNCKIAEGEALVCLTHLTDLVHESACHPLLGCNLDGFLEGVASVALLVATDQQPQISATATPNGVKEF